MIFSKILYDNDNAAEAIFTGDTVHLEVELKAILESMAINSDLRPTLLKATNDIADRLEEELRNEQE